MGVKIQLKNSTFEPYEIIKPMGRGKYSEVYEGYDTVNDQRVVVKILKPGKIFSS